MPDDLVPGDVIAVLKPPNEAQGRADLLAPIEDLLVGPVRALAGRLDHLDADRDVVEADRVATADRGRDELVDRPVLLDHVVRADARPLAEVDGVGVERAPYRLVAVGCGEV